MTKNIKYNIFLDDVRKPEDVFKYTNNKIYLLSWVIVRDYDQFVKIVEKCGIDNIDTISYDHDLCYQHYAYVGRKKEDLEEYYRDEYREMTGYDCAKWLCDYCLEKNKKMPKYLIHSMNAVGSRNIDSYIKNFSKHCDI